MSVEANELLTIEETTELTGLSRMTLFRLVRDGDLEQRVVRGSGRGGAKRIPLQSLTALFTNCTVGAEQREGQVTEQQMPEKLTTLREFALAFGIPYRGFAQAAREEKFKHVRINGRRYMTPSLGELYFAQHTVTVREDDELAAERDRHERNRSRRSSSRRSTTSRAAA